MNFDRGSSGQIGEQWYVLAAFDRSRLSLDGTSKRESLEIDRMQECSDAIHADSSGQDIFVAAGEDTKTVKAMKAMKMTKTVTKAAVPQPKATKAMKAMKMTKAVTKAAGSREGHEGHEDDEGR